ncbi:MAG: PAS domain S-box protein, partial [Candidatus Binatia bacterium]
MADESTLDLSLREAHRRRIATQLPNLGWVVTGASVMWFALATLADPAAVRAVASPGAMVGILALQGTIFAAAAALGRRDPTGDRVTALAVTTCFVVGLMWAWFLTTTSTVAAMLMFATLTLLGAAPLVLAWGLGPQLAFQGGLTAAWLFALAQLPHHLRMTELVSAIAFGNLMALAATQWAAQSFRTEVRAGFAALDLDRQITASRDAYRALAENAVDFIWAIDLQGRWTYVNEALARRCGMRVSDMIGQPVQAILAPDPSHSDPRESIARMSAGEPIESQVWHMAAVDGPCWVEAVASPIHGPTGEVIGIQGVSRDVTERCLAEDALRASEERFRGVFDNAPVGMAVVTPDGAGMQVNRALSTMLGYDDGALIGKEVWDVLHPDDVPAIETLVASARVGERDGFSLACRHLHREGRVVWTQLHALLERTPDGSPSRFISQVEDITEQRAAEAALRSSEHRFRSFAESMAAGVFMARPDGIVYVNEAVSTITGFTRDELFGMQVWDLVHPDERAAARQKLTARLNGESLDPRAAYRLATKSGVARWVDITVAMVDLDGAPVMLGTAFDVTERKLAEEALRSSEARYRGLVESHHELVLRFDADGRVTFANDAYCDTYGVALDHAIGAPFWPFVHPADVEQLRIAVHATMQPPYRTNVEVRSRTVHGWRWFEWEASAVRDPNGVVLEGQAAGRDVTERRRTQDDLRAS